MHQIFIASSLKLQKHRDIVQKAAEEWPETYRVFRYEGYPKQREDGSVELENGGILQMLERDDAQKPIDEVLFRSSIMFLIVDGKIKPLTEWEFSQAVENFRRHRSPDFIFVFRRNGDENTITEGKSYETVIKDNELTTFRYDAKFNIQPHFLVYDIPFNNYDELSVKVGDILTKLRGNLPFEGSKRNNGLLKEDFYRDQVRLDGYHEIYIERRMDKHLPKIIMENKMTVILGESLSGKTRAAMNALSKVDDGWIYVLDETLGQAERCEKLSQIAEYLRNRPHNEPKQYVVLDNLHLLLSDEKVFSAIKSLARQVNDSNASIVATASSDNDYADLIMNTGLVVCKVNIPSMTKDEYKKVLNVINSYGILCYQNYTKNHVCKNINIGALFVGLDMCIKRLENYVRFGSIVDDLEKSSGDDILARLKLLYSIKAHSIWKRTNMEDKESIVNMAVYLMKKNRPEMKYVEVEERVKYALETLCRCQLGVTENRNEDGSTGLSIQEFFTRYFVDFHDFREDEIVKFNHKSYVDEKSMIIKLLCYIKDIDTGIDIDFSYTECLAKIASRCENKKEIIPWLFGLWSGKRKPRGMDCDLPCSVFEEKHKFEVEEQPYNEKRESMYALLYYMAITQTDGFQDARELYLDSKIRTNILLGALMDKAKTEDEWKFIRELPEYEKYSTDSFILMREVAQADSFNQAREVLRKLVPECTPQKAAALRLKFWDNKKDIQSEEKKILYNLWDITNSVNSLGKKVKTNEDLIEYLNILRSNFFYIISDRDVLSKIKDAFLSVNISKLTTVELLCSLQLSTVRNIVKKVYANNINAMKSFPQLVGESLEKTLARGYTNELMIRLSMSAAANAIIEEARDIPYPEIYECFFRAMQFSLLGNNKQMKLLDIYAYNYLLSKDDCDFVSGYSLFENDLMQHVKDKNNQIFVSVNILNSLLKKTEGKANYVEKVDSLYDRLGIKRDCYTYNTLLNYAHSFEKGIEIVRKMIHERIDIDNYTLSGLFKLSPNLKTAISLLCLPPNIVQEDYCLVNLEEDYDEGNVDAVFNHVFDKIKKKEVSLFTNSTSIAPLFNIECNCAADREAFHRCLQFLEKEYPSIFEDGSLYNQIVKNVSFLESFLEAEQFCQERINKGVLKPDSLTLNAFTDRVAGVVGADRNMLICRLNNVYLELHPLIDNKNDKNLTIPYTNRIRLYRDANDNCKLLFYDVLTGEMSNDYLSVQKYLKKMFQCGIKINSHTIYKVINLKGISDSVINQLGEMLLQQDKSKVFHFNNEDVHAIRELYRRYPNALSLRQLIEKDDFPVLKPSEFNKAISFAYNAKNMDLDEMLNKLSWEDSYSANLAFNNILTNYINYHESNYQGRTGDMSVFQVLWKLYNKYIVAGNRSPISDTFAVLSKAAVTSKEIKDIVLVEFFKQQKAISSLYVVPQIFCELITKCCNYQELIEEVQSYCANGWVTNMQCLEQCVYKMILLSGNERQVKGPLSKIFNYILYGCADYQGKLSLLENDLPVLKHLRNKTDITANLFLNFVKYKSYDFSKRNIYCKNNCSLFVFCVYQHYQNLIFDSKDGLITKMEEEFRKFEDYLSKDKKKLVEYQKQNDLDNIEKCEKTIIRKEQYLDAFSKLSFLLFVHEQPGTMSFISNDVLSFIIREGVNHIWLRKEDAIMKFVESLHRLDCRKISIVVPILANELYKCRDSLSKKAKSVCDRIIVYSRINKLRNGHLLFLSKGETIPDDRWSLYGIDGHYVWKEIQNMFGGDNEQLNYKKIIALAEEHIGDAYCSCLKVLYYSRVKQVDRETFVRIQKMERNYANDIHDNSISFNEIKRLPQLWQRSNWKPSKLLVFELVKAYSRAQNCDNEQIRDEAFEYVGKIKKDCIQSNKISYSSLGLCDNTQYFIPLFDQEQLLEAIQDPSRSVEHFTQKYTQALLCKEMNKSIFRHIEKNLAYDINRDEIPFAEIVKLPSKWSQAQKNPSEQLVLEIVKYYARNGKLIKEAQKYLCLIQKRILSFSKRNKKSYLVLNYDMLGRYQGERCFRIANPKRLVEAIACPDRDVECISIFETRQSSNLKK